MALDLLGPTIGARGVTNRPTDGRAFTPTDTFFQDCSSETADDGTELSAAWHNQVTAILRALARGNGQSGLGSDVVTQDNADDLILLKAVQQVVQRNQPKFALDTGSANHVVVALSPAAVEYKNGMIIEAVIAANNTGASDLSVNGLGVVPIVRSDGTPSQQGDLLAGQFQAFGYYNGKAQLVWSQRMPGAPIYLQAARDFYVSNSGSDANDGSAGAPWATLQKAADFITKFNLNGYSITIHVADGTYSQLSVRMMGGSGSVYWVGNHNNPGNCVIAGNGRSAIGASNCGAAHQFDGFTVTAGGTFAGDGLNGIQVSGGGTNVQVTNINWGACAGCHLAVSQAAVVTYQGAMYVSGSPLGSTPVSAIACHILCTDGAIIQIPSLGSVTLAINAGSISTFAWVVCSTLAFCQIQYSSISNGGVVSGQRFQVNNFAVLSVLGSGPNHYPGNSAGTTSNGIYG